MQRASHNCVGASEAPLLASERWAGSRDERRRWSFRLYRFVLFDVSFVWTHLSRQLASCLPRQDERPFHVHRHGDELEMAGVTGEAEIADPAHAVPALHCRGGAFDARANARGPGVAPFLPGLQRMAAAGAP